MLFKPRFFLDLSGEGDANSKPAQIAPLKKEAAAEPKRPASQPAPATATESAASAPATATPTTVAAAPPAAQSLAAPSPQEPLPSAGSGPSLTTAEAIAAELAQAQANRPAPSQATFAPDCLAAGAAVPRRRRLAGANLGLFKQMAQGMMKS
jgi:hypothetical protein